MLKKFDVKEFDVKKFDANIYHHAKTETSNFELSNLERRTLNSEPFLRTTKQSVSEGFDAQDIPSSPQLWEIATLRYRSARNDGWISSVRHREEAEGDEAIYPRKGLTLKTYRHHLNQTRLPRSVSLRSQ